MDAMRGQRVFLETLRIKAEESLRSKPEGSLTICSEKNKVQYFYRNQPGVKKGVYISKKEKELISELAQKDYDHKFLEAVRKLTCETDRLIRLGGQREIHEVYKRLGQVYASLSLPRQKLVSPYILPDDLFVREWLGVKYEGNTFPAGTAEILTENGERVRSKSEKIIADKLLKMGIPYRYEFPLKTKTMGIVFPDFTLLDIWNRKEIIQEHFGLMDDEAYRNKTMSKIRAYILDGYEVGKNLVYTMETKAQPLDVRQFERMMRMLFPFL